MRRALVVILLVLLLVALDAAFNSWQVSSAIYLELGEFWRIATRTFQGGL
jgi:hypothetical protein